MFKRIFPGHDPNYKSYFSPAVLKRNNLILLTCLIILILFLPAISIDGMHLFVDIILSLIIIVGVSSLEFNKKTMKILSYFGAISLLLIWINNILGGDTIKMITNVALVCFIIFITLNMIIYIAKSRKVTSVIILNAINSYLLMGLIGSYLFAITELVHHYILGYTTRAIQFASGSGSEFHDFIYFSFVTMTTLGYGDITPVSSLAKSITLLVSISGQLYLTILVATLVGKLLSNPDSIK
jgi:voltage-gated potassium channel